MQIRKPHSTFKSTNSKNDVPIKLNAFEPDATLLSSLIESLPLNIYAKDKDGTFIFANTIYCTSVAKKQSEIIGKTDFDIHPENLALKYRHDDQRVMQNLRAEVIEEAWQSKETTRSSYSRVIKSPLYSNSRDRTVIGTIGIFWDITDQKKTEMELAEERKLLRTLIDSLPDYIYVKDVDSKFILGNRALLELVGATCQEEIVGKSDYDFFSREEAAQFRKDELYVLQEDKPLEDIEEQVHRARSEERWTLTSKLPLKNISGTIVGLVGTGHDITLRKKEEEERQQLESQLLHAQKMETVGTLTAGIAHDFNNLLSVINGYAELLTLDMSADDPTFNELQKIREAGVSAAQLVGQLMAFSRKQVVQERVINVNSLLASFENMLQRLIGATIEIKLNLQPDLWLIEIDPTQMNQIVVNFTANSRDAIVDGGCILIETANVTITELNTPNNSELKPGDYVRFSVIDDGSGIKKELHGRIFEPFFTTKHKSKGTGLGLATIFGIVKQNNGIIELVSEEGQGTSFHVYFPRSHSLIAPTIPLADDNDLPRGSESILVAEDEKDVRNLVAAVLLKQGYSVQHAPNGQQALAAVEKMGGKKIDLLITDVVMPGMSGRELAEKTLLHTPDIKILFMSGYTNDELNQYDLTDPQTAFIQKPFSPAALTKKVRELFDS